MAQLAIKGGTPVKTDDFPLWPVFDEREEEVITQVLDPESGGGTVSVRELICTRQGKRENPE